MFADGCGTAMVVVGCLYFVFPSDFVAVQVIQWKLAASLVLLGAFLCGWGMALQSEWIAVMIIKAHRSLMEKDENYKKFVLEINLACETSLDSKFASRVSSSELVVPTAGMEAVS